MASHEHRKFTSSYDSSRSDKRPSLLIAMILSSGVVLVDATAMNVALPSIDAQLHVGFTGMQWIIDGYNLTLASFLLLGGTIGDIFGRRRVVIYSLIAFAVASVLCGSVTNGFLLIGSRVLQGIAGAFLVPAPLAIITHEYSDHQGRGKAIGIWSAWTGIAALIGPIIGGWLVTYSWRYVFFLNVPLVVVTLWLLIKELPRSDRQRGVKVDWLGAFYASTGLGGLTYALIEGPGRHWLELRVLLTAAIGIVALLLFIPHEKQTKNPMMPMELWSRRNFAGANFATLLIYSALFGSFFLQTLYIQNVMGYSALASGLYLLPVTIMLFLFSTKFGQLAARRGARLYMTVGPLCLAAGLLLMFFVRSDSNPLFTITPISALIGLGLSMTVAPLTATVMGSVPRDSGGVASAVNNLTSRIAGLLSVAIVGVVLSVVFHLYLNTKDMGDVFVSGNAEPLRTKTEQAMHATVLSDDMQRAADTTAFHFAMACCALFAIGGAAVSFMTIDRANSPNETEQEVFA